MRGWRDVLSRTTGAFLLSSLFTLAASGPDCSIAGGSLRCHSALAFVGSELEPETLLGISYPLYGAQRNLEFAIAQRTDTDDRDSSQPFSNPEIALCHDPLQRFANRNRQACIYHIHAIMCPNYPVRPNP